MSRVSRRIGNEKLGMNRQLAEIMRGRPREHLPKPDKAKAIDYPGAHRYRTDETRDAP